MRTTALTLLACCVAALCPGPARASGDFTCTPAWRLQQEAMTECSNLAYLNPYNDSRVNLLLLLSDAEPSLLRGNGAMPASSDPLFTWGDLAAVAGRRPRADDGSGDFADGEGSRCRSNAAGLAAFTAAVTASDDLSEDERRALVEARTALAPTCAGNPSPAAAPDGLHSPSSQAFWTYLAGAAAFYRGDYRAAGDSFAALDGSQQPWLKETAAYMLGRVAVNRAQAGAFDDLGALDRAKVDRSALADAERQFSAYLRLHPTGRYAASATGLMRRVYWLGGERAKLAAQFAQALAPPGPATADGALPRLLDEVDDKLLGTLDPNGVDDPKLLAVLDLMGMRSVASGTADARKPLSRADLDAQQPRFAAAPALYAYLRAVHALFVGHDPDRALSLLPSGPPTRPLHALAYSEAVLRGAALEAKGDRAGARSVWRALLPLTLAPFEPAAAQLGLARSWEADRQLAAVFEPQSPVRVQSLRDILLRNDAGPDLLRARIGAPDSSPEERHGAKFVLLYRDVSRARYADFARDHDLPLPPDAADTAENEDRLGVFDWPGGSTADEFRCPSLRDTAAALARAPRQPLGLLCLGEFIRLNGFDKHKLDDKPPAPELGSTPGEFPGTLFSRLDGYKLVIADPRATAGEKGYALFRAVNCYAPRGDNDCGGAGVPVAQRKAWFLRLKREYPTSRWAQQLAYYW